MFFFKNEIRYWAHINLHPFSKSNQMLSWHQTSSWLLELDISQKLISFLLYHLAAVEKNLCLPEIAFQVCFPLVDPRPEEMRKRNRLNKYFTNIGRNSSHKGQKYFTHMTEILYTYWRNTSLIMRKLIKSVVKTS